MKIMKRNSVWKLLCCILLIIGTVAVAILPTAGLSTPEKEIDALCVPAFAMRKPSKKSYTPSNTEATTDADSGMTVAPEMLRDLQVYPGGMPFGVKFFTEGVTVVGLSEVEGKSGKVNPAARAGIKQKDVILSVNGEPLSGASALTELIENCGGNALTLHCKRGGSEFDTKLQPEWCEAESRYKTGIWVRDSGAGIGTVTFLIPETGAFAGLGHGICDADTGALIPMKRGSVSDVTISSVVRGAAGAPGELKGYFNAGKVGSLLGNSSSGVWGVYTELPELNCEPMPVGLRDEIEEGDAYILSTLDSNQIERYDIRISNINRDAKGSKCFTVTVTDPDLLAASGGIVQGMGVCYNRDNTVKLE
ncbi:MAG: hypothetical protein E7637_09350 [Ruminococcaceae bacterium]|nr:hypothetical protein [Oscillospiraceae bacterium]